MPGSQQEPWLLRVTWKGDLNMLSYKDLGLSIRLGLHSCSFSLTFAKGRERQKADSTRILPCSPRRVEATQFPLNYQSITSARRVTLSFDTWFTRVRSKRGQRQPHLPFNGSTVAPGGDTPPLGTKTYKSSESKTARARRQRFISRVVVSRGD